MSRRAVATRPAPELDDGEPQESPVASRPLRQGDAGTVRLQVQTRRPPPIRSSRRAASGLARGQSGRVRGMDGTTDSAVPG
jgi:hypothetical protein